MEPVQDVERRRSNLSQAKRDLFDDRLRRAHLERLDTTIEPRPDRAEAPLSFAQQRLWFLQQLDPESSVYNECAALRLSGPLDVEALHDSIRAVAMRHEVLRCTFGLQHGRLYQLIHPELQAAATPPLVDLRRVPVEERESEIQRLVSAESDFVFDLESGPLFRVQVLQADDEDYVVVHTSHHIACDGWSVGLLVHEVATLYAVATRGAPSALAPLPIQYADYARWQREYLDGPLLESEMAYWRRALHGAPLTLDLPTDLPRPAVQTGRGARHDFCLPRALAARVEQLSRRAGATTFMTLVAVLATLLHKYSGQSDMVIGTPTAGRSRPECESLIGFFINTLPLRVQLHPDLCFEDLQHRVRQTALDVFEHQDMPFERLVEELQPDRNLGRSPIFQVMFALENFPTVEDELPGLLASEIELQGHTAKFDLTLFVRETDRGMECSFEYSTDLFEPATVARMAEHLECLLETVVAEPKRPIRDFALLSPEAREAALASGRSGEPTPIPPTTIDGLVESQAARTPESVAVEAPGESLTYRELLAQATRLAENLLALGVRPGDAVGLAVGRSAAMVVGLLGILKAGATYLPLDPAFPEERIAFMLADSAVDVVLTDAAVAELLAQPSMRRTDAVRLHDTTPEDRAYLIYTSGSTGTPKGVAVQHRAVVNFLTAMSRLLEPRPDDVFVALTTLSFDIAALEILLPLTVGARTVVLGRDEALDGYALAAALEASDATVIQATPTTYRMLLATGWLAPGRRMSTLLVGGEGLPWDLARALHARCDALWNLYGPTETTIWSTALRVTTGTVQRGPWVPIGRPIANTTVHVLDDSLEPVPIGVPGELYIGGAGLAHGYHNQPDLTAQRFVADPFGTDGTLYRTGDRGRVLVDGLLEAMGRKDNQVKLRGFRIELGEIEAALGRHPDVAHAAAAVQERSGERSLQAFAVAVPGTSPGEEALQTWLRRRLPEYMVPARVSLLDALPSTPNGKLDRAALVAAIHGVPRSSHPHVPPRTHSEEVLASIWADILGIEHVGVHDNFFAVGGHSILAAMMVSRARQAFDLEVPVRWAFEMPTVAQLTERIEAAATVEAGVALPSIRRTRGRERIPLSLAQEALWSLDQAVPGVPFTVQSAGLLDGPIDYRLLANSFEVLIRRHEALRTTVALVDGQPYQNVAPPSPFDLPVVDLSAHEPRRRDTLVAQILRSEGERPFDLMSGPLLRVKLMRLKDEEHALTLVTHHLISDCWSHEIIARDLRAIYGAFASGDRVTLPALDLRYGDYTAWQRSVLKAGGWAPQAEYWRKTLGDIPTQGPEVRTPSYRFTRDSLHLGPELVRDLRDLCRREGTTLFVLLLTALKLLLLKTDGVTDVRVATRTANRTRVELEGVVGLFANTLVMRTDLSGDPSLPEAIQRVHRVVISAYDNQDLPFEEVLEGLSTRTGATGTSLFDTLFIYQSLPARPRDMAPGLTGRDLVVDEDIRDELLFTSARLIVDICESPDAVTMAFKGAVGASRPTNLGELAGAYHGLLQSFVDRRAR